MATKNPLWFLNCVKADLEDRIYQLKPKLAKNIEYKIGDFIWYIWDYQIGSGKIVDILENAISEWYVYVLDSNNNIPIDKDACFSNLEDAYIFLEYYICIYMLEGLQYRISWNEENRKKING